MEGDFWGNEALVQEVEGMVEAMSITPCSSHAPPSPTAGNAPPQASPSAAPPEQEDEFLEEVKSLLQQISITAPLLSKHNIEIQRRDPFSPLNSVRSFEALPLKPELLKGVYQMGYNTPSKIQGTALPSLLSEPPHNMIGQAQSGTGKTATFVLAMLSRINPANKYPQALCLSPTYELAIQTGEVAAKIGQFCSNIRIRYAIRGEDVPRGSRLTEHIIVGTPGKVMDWVIKYKFFDIEKIQVFVLDEADVMIATQGYQDQSFRIRRGLSDQCQIILFSATYDEEVMKFANYMVPNPVLIRLKREEESLDNIKQFYVVCLSQAAKYNAIANIYRSMTIGQVIIFCKTRQTASWLSKKMALDGHAVALISGEMPLEQRLSILDRFREGKEKVLIATNVISRGIDIEQVTIVINFDMPIDMNRQADCETYLHRIGRTGRFGVTGYAINLVSPSEVTTIIPQIQDHFGRVMGVLDTDDSDAMENLQH